MRRGFTMIELMIASTIGAIITTAVSGMLLGLFVMMRETSDELRVSLHARALRTKLLYQSLSGGGLTSAKSISVYNTDYLKVFTPSSPARGDAIKISAYELNRSADSDHKHTKNVPFAYVDGIGTNECVFVYLKAQKGSATYTDRIIVPLWGRQYDNGTDYLTTYLNLFRGKLVDKP